jgi:hypothetical protein
MNAAARRIKTIPDFPRYVVSDAGEVFRGTRKLKPRLRRGYSVVDLYNEGAKRTCYVHILVMAAFGPPQPEGKGQVRHLDGNRTNAAITNLAWGDQSDNEADKIATGTKYAGERHHRCKLTDDDVKRIRFTKGWSAIAIASVFEVHPSTIRRIRNGTSRTGRQAA